MPASNKIGGGNRPAGLSDGLGLFVCNHSSRISTRSKVYEPDKEEALEGGG